MAATVLGGLPGRLKVLAAVQTGLGIRAADEDRFGRAVERIFAEAGVSTSEELDCIRSEGGLGLFVRSLVGLDRVAAKRVFDGFFQGRNLTAHQLEFVNMMIDHLTERGTMNPRLLYELPFTDFNPLSVDGMFKKGEVVELTQILRDVQERAAA